MPQNNHKKLLLLQHRPEDELYNDEKSSIISAGASKDQIRSIRMEKGQLPNINVLDYSAVILGGGPSNISNPLSKKYQYQKNFEPWLNNHILKIIENDIPFLGLCYGVGALIKNYGGVVSDKYSESVSAVKISLTKQGLSDKICYDIPKNFRAFVGHKEAGETLPKNAILLATSKECPIQMFKIKQNIYATQFHPELDFNGLKLRVEAYKHLGYFKPEEANQILNSVKKYDVSYPQLILKNFIKIYLS